MCLDQPDHLRSSRNQEKQKKLLQNPPKNCAAAVSFEDPLVRINHIVEIQQVRPVHFQISDTYTPLGQWLLAVKIWGFCAPDLACGAPHVSNLRPRLTLTTRT